MLTLIRLVDQETDMLVTINVPHVPGSYEAGSVDLEGGWNDAYFRCGSKE
jgi:hypothetical protein